MIGHQSATATVRRHAAPRNHDHQLDGHERRTTQADHLGSHDHHGHHESNHEATSLDRTALLA